MNVFGYAAGCEARACRAGNSCNYSLGYAPGSSLALRIDWARGRTKGIAQIIKALSTAGQRHRLTSGGKAEPNMTTDF